MENNDLLSRVLIESIEKFNSGVEASVAFAAEQAPEVIQQALAWNMAYSLITFAIGLILIPVAIAIPFVIFKLTRNLKCETDKALTPPAATMAIYTVVLPVIYCNLNLTWLKIWIAPKLWLIEYAASLVK